MSLLMSPTVKSLVTPTGSIITAPLPVVVAPSVTLTTMALPNIDSGLNDNPMAQLQMREYIHYKFLDKWLREDFYACMSRLKITGGKVSVIKSDAEVKKNDISKLSEEELEMMADFVEEKILSKKTTRKIIIQILEQSNLKWYELPNNEELVKHVIAHYVSNQLKKL